MWAEDNQVILPARTALFLSLPERPYRVKRFGFNKCYSIQLLGIAPQKPSSRAGVAQWLHFLRREQLLQSRAEGKSALNDSPWGIWVCSIIQLPEMGVEGSSAPGRGEGTGAHPGNWEFFVSSPLLAHPRPNCAITCAASGPWVPEKPGRCFSSQSLFLALPPAGRKIPFQTGWRMGQELQQQRLGEHRTAPSSATQREG